MLKLKSTGMDTARTSPPTHLLTAMFQIVILTMLLTLGFGITFEQPPTALPRFPFTGNSGLQVPDSNDPLTYLSWRRRDWYHHERNKLVCRTDEHLNAPKSRTRHWEPVTADDIIWLFFGILVLQGVVKKLQQRWHWTMQQFHFYDYIVCNRFLLVFTAA